MFCLVKKLNNSKIHWATSTIFVCWFGIPFALTISGVLVRMGLSHSNIQGELRDIPMDLFYSSLSSIISLMGQISLNIGLQYEDATKIAITKTIDVLFTAVFQFLILNISMDFLNIMGALSILLGASFVIMFKIVEKKYEIYKRENPQLENEERNTLKGILLKIIFIKI